MNFAARVYAHGAERPYQRALVAPGPRQGDQPSWRHMTFGRLTDRAKRLAAGFIKRGLTEGDRVMMLVPAGFEFFEVSLALWQIGAVPVLIDPGMGLSGFLSCTAQIRPRVLIGIPRGMLLAAVRSGPFRSVEDRITVGGSTWFWGGATLDACRSESPRTELAPADVDTEAGVLFTSGSTGPAKGVRYTHGMFGTQAERIQAMYDIVPGNLDVSCFLPFAMFSVAMGVTCVLPDMDFAKPATAAPRAILEAVEEHGASQLVASPAVLVRMAPWLAERGQEMPSLDRILTFGAPIPRPLHEAFRTVLREGAAIHTPYGATEALPVATIDGHTILAETGARSASGEGTCVGRPDESIEVRVLAITDEPLATMAEATVLPPGEVGEITVRGVQVSREYKDRPDANAASKVQDGDTFWHRMGDLGYLDDQGRLWFCGRKSHRVTLADGRLRFPVPVEGIFNEHPAVRRSALVGVDGTAVLVVELNAGVTETPKLLDEIGALGRGHEVASDVTRLLVHPGFPVDRRHNAKIHRPEIAKWAAGRAGHPVRRGDA
ncbi:MAG: fatty acid CoA ligase family protein [Myxococcota bacterium]